MCVGCGGVPTFCNTEALFVLIRWFVVVVGDIAALPDANAAQLGGNGWAAAAVAAAAQNEMGEK